MAVAGGAGILRPDEGTVISPRRGIGLQWWPSQWLQRWPATTTRTAGNAPACATRHGCSPSTSPRRRVAASTRRVPAAARHRPGTFAHPQHLHPLTRPSPHFGRVYALCGVLHAVLCSAPACMRFLPLLPIVPPQVNRAPATSSKGDVFARMIASARKTAGVEAPPPSATAPAKSPAVSAAPANSGGGDNSIAAAIARARAIAAQLASGGGAGASGASSSSGSTLGKRKNRWDTDVRELLLGLHVW